MLPWKLRKCQLLPANQNLSSVYFSLAKFQLVSCNPSLAMIWQMTYTHKLPTLSGGAERHVCSLAYLIMLKSSVFFFPPYFCSEPIFGTLSISVHTTVGSLIHVPSFQKQLSVCINITLTMASIIRISQEKK